MPPEQPANTVRSRTKSGRNSHGRSHQVALQAKTGVGVLPTGTAISGPVQPGGASGIDRPILCEIGRGGQGENCIFNSGFVDHV